MTGLRILLFSLYYHPEPTGNAPYVTRWARHLASSHSVTVVSGHPHYPSWTVRRIPSDQQSNPRVIRYSHFVPRRPTAFGRALYELSWLGSAGRSVVTRRPYHIVIGHIPSLSGAVLAMVAGRRFRSPVGLVFHDLVGPGASQSGVASAGAGRRVAGAEAALARGAAQVAVLCEDFVPYLTSQGVDARRVQRLRSWGRLGRPNSDVQQTRRRLGWSPTDFVCLHAGNMGQKQGLENLVEAARYLPSGNVRLVLAGDGNDRPNLASRAASLQLTNVNFLPLQPPGDYESMLEAADVLLVNQRHTVKEMSIPSKLTAYFSAGRPIIAAVDSESAAAREVTRAAAGMVIPPGDPDALAATVMALQSTADRRAQFGRNGRDYAERTLNGDADLEDYDRFISRLNTRASGATP